ncbi:hypothetical protein R7070_21235 [Vibrio sp. 1557]|uniref:hypothetical protein n=1 Tax=Vibrio sp. 1557 TaxID=3074561 RepID=UPI0021D0847F|nr:hypothetical protein [Vibrio sp. 1557]MDW2265282.1 hypothetical protein [Vibrio sp. 1557]
MKRLLLAAMCLLTATGQAETICKTDAIGITRCKDSNGVVMDQSVRKILTVL